MRGADGHIEVSPDSTTPHTYTLRAPSLPRDGLLDKPARWLQSVATGAWPVMTAIAPIYIPAGPLQPAAARAGRQGTAMHAQPGGGTRQATLCPMTHGGSLADGLYQCDGGQGAGGARKAAGLHNMQTRGGGGWGAGPVRHQNVAEQMSGKRKDGGHALGPGAVQLPSKAACRF